jgi:hypothetical protein
MTIFSLVFLIQPGICLFAADAPPIEGRADEILKQMGDYLKKADQFTFNSEAYFEQVLENGQKLQYNSIAKVALQRPNRLRVDSRGDVANESYYYNGKQITHFDHRSNTYASVKVPATIDAAIDFLAEQYGLTPPLADLVYKDPYRILIQNVKSGAYIGLSRVRESMCYHLAFQQDEIDWQIWIDAGWMRVPRKVVITYKKAAGVPQYMAFLSEWDFTPRFPGDLFDFRAPPNAEQVEFDPSAK